MFGIKTKFIKLIDPYLNNDNLTNVRLDPSGITCNHKCVMCWRQQLTKMQRKELTKNFQENKLNLDDYKQLINSLPKTVKKIELVGAGEPLMFSDIKKLIRFIKQKKYSCSLITNGVFLNKSIRQILIASNWDYIRVSLHAGTEKTYKKIHGKDDFKNVIGNIKALLKERKNKLPYIKLLFVIQKQNFHEIKNFVTLAEKIGVDEIEFDYLTPNSKKELFLNENELTLVKKQFYKTNIPLKNNIESVKKMLTNNAWSTNREKKEFFLKNRTCQLHHLEISQTGITVPCCLLWNSEINKNLNIKKIDIKNIWKIYKPLRSNLNKGKFPQDCIKNCYYDLNSR